MRRQSGFTIIEIIIVVIILGLLAATALPRFLNVTEQAEDASIDGIAGGFASAIGLVRGQWEVEGRPVGNGLDGASTVQNLTTIAIDGIRIAVNGNGTGNGVSLGYPTANPATVTPALTNSTHTTTTSLRCKEILDVVLQNAPASVAFATTADTVAEIQNANVTLLAREGTGTNTANVCYYYQTAGLTEVPDPDGATQIFNGFSYNPANGKVTVFKNKP